MGRLFRELVRLTEQRRPGFEPRSSMALGGLLAELSAVRERTTPSSNTNRGGRVLSPQIVAAIQIMYIEHSVPQSVEKVAEYAQMSPGRFAHRFREEVGVSPMAWLTRFRMQRARELLEWSRRPVREVGSMVGVPEPARFARMFRQYTGMSPRMYRKRLGMATAMGPRIGNAGTGRQPLPRGQQYSLSPVLGIRK